MLASRACIKKFSRSSLEVASTVIELLLSGRLASAMRIAVVIMAGYSAVLERLIFCAFSHAVQASSQGKNVSKLEKIKQII